MEILMQLLYITVLLSIYSVLYKILIIVLIFHKIQMSVCHSFI